MSDAGRKFFPAAGRDLFLPLYDPVVELLGGGAARAALIAQGKLSSAERVLDLGCGTGTMAIQIRKQFPGIGIVGLDPDPKALARARRKAEREGLAIPFDQGFGDELPYATASFDRVFSSLMLHHLEAADRANTLREVRRVLRAGGEFHMMDFEARGDQERGFFGNLLHAHAHLKDNSPVKILATLKEAGFGEAAKIGSRRMIVGEVAYYRAVT